MTNTTKPRTNNEELEKQAKEAWENLKISNDFLFSKIMEDEKLCKKLLEVILDEKIDRIEYPETEKTMRITEDGKGVRLDVYILDEEHTVYNVEMQATNTYELPERTRYYQGIIDMDIIAKGKSYQTLKKSYIIFICTFDLFDAGLYKYTFENRCKEYPELSLGDGTQKIFLNAKGLLDDAGEDMKAFLKYVDGEESENAFVQQIKQRAMDVKQNIKWRSDYMMQHMREQFKLEEGIEQGKILDKVELTRKNLDKLMKLDLIAEFLGVEQSYIESIHKMILEHPDITNAEITERLMQNKK